MPRTRKIAGPEADAALRAPFATARRDCAVVRILPADPSRCRSCGGAGRGPHDRQHHAAPRSNAPRSSSASPASARNRRCADMAAPTPIGQRVRLTLILPAASAGGTSHGAWHVERRGVHRARGRTLADADDARAQCASGMGR